MRNRIDKAKLQEVADSYHLDLVVMFGSYAKRKSRSASSPLLALGDPRPDDLDIAVRTTREEFLGFSSFNKARWQWEMNLTASLEAIIGLPYDIDLVVLNGVFDSTFLFEVARYGELIYQREPSTFVRFRAYAARRFDDDAKFRRWGWEYLKRRCLNAE